jgi:hypothetical protein
VKLRVVGSAAGARRAVPLQLQHSRKISVVIEFVRDPKRIREKSALANPTQTVLRARLRIKSLCYKNLWKIAGTQFAQSGCALQANVIIGIVPLAIAQHGENAWVRGAAFATRPQRIDEQIDR